ncbi:MULTISPECIES: hypothetical protein, partial [unclassified Endozoicomonas]|uniref:hypothetical protein n=1 Tax=unclassified Endozoicomonas TaxID=2644528 RepID=UPI0021486FB7
MSDVLTRLRSDNENREELDTRLLALLHAEQDQEELCVSRLNRFLNAEARELAFQLAGSLSDLSVRSEDCKKLR